MLFNSWSFVFFFLLVAGLYYCLAPRMQNVLLLVSSYVFYSFWDWRFAGLLLLSTCVDYKVALRMEGLAEPARRKRWLLVSIMFNLGVLGFFKYFNFFRESLEATFEGFGLSLDALTLSVILPVGISFYTFQTMAYTIDVYRRKQPAVRDPLVYGVYVAYFPQLVAGPIERAQRLIPQLQRKRSVSREDAHSGVQLLLWGYLKKVAVADSLAPHVDAVFSQPGAHSPLVLWLAMYAFALQIYCDFSGYTDIARGVSRLLGIDLMVNFRQPYFARNITQFWRRWHISLSTWLRDYLYIPLGGNRKGVKRLYANLMITMLLGGLWHGAAWTFVLWGGLHGAFLAVHRLLSGHMRPAEGDSPSGVMSKLMYCVSALCTFQLVCFAWIPFRADSYSILSEYVTRMMEFGASGSDELVQVLAFALVFYGLLVAFIDLLCLRKDSELPLGASSPVWLRTAAYASALIVLSFVRESTHEAFIYFQF